MLRTSAQRARTIWLINAAMAASICVLCWLVIQLTGDAALLPGIPMIMLMVSLPISILYGLYCSYLSFRDRPVRRDDQESGSAPQRDSMHTL